MAQLTALVTGADRGLGLALCADLLDKGWRVFAGQFMADWPELSELRSRYDAEQLTLVPLDVGDTASVTDAAALVTRQCECLDMLISNAGINPQDQKLSIHEPLEYATMLRSYDVNALGALRTVGSFLPLLDRGSMKRLCFVSSEAGSIARSHRSSWFGYCMSKAALNMGASILFNDLRPAGYSFRVYHPGWIRSYITGKRNPTADLEPAEAARRALLYFLANSAASPENPCSIDEDHLEMRDFDGNVWPW
jgi:NAD(P)-dependent dehydrogenase (short-subunit alcohol dehydrogenase family)